MHQMHLIVSNIIFPSVDKTYYLQLVNIYTNYQRLDTHDHIICKLLQLVIFTVQYYKNYKSNYLKFFTLVIGNTLESLQRHLKH